MLGHLGLHVIKFPSGRYGYVGSIPRDLGHEKPASDSDVMGGRSYRNTTGEIVATKFPTSATPASAGAWKCNEKPIRNLCQNGCSP